MKRSIALVLALSLIASPAMASTFSTLHLAQVSGNREARATDSNPVRIKYNKLIQAGIPAEKINFVVVEFKKDKPYTILEVVTEKETYYLDANLSRVVDKTYLLDMGYKFRK